VSDLKGGLGRYTILTHLYMLNQNKILYFPVYLYRKKCPRSIFINLLQSVNATQVILAIDSTKCPFTVLSLCKNGKGNIF